MATSIIRFLDTKQTVAVETPLALDVSWGDRVSRTQEGPCVYGSLAGQPYGTPGDLRVEVGPTCGWWERGDAIVRGSVDGYAAELTEEQRGAALETYRLVGEAWRAAIATRPEITYAVESYRRIQDSISAEHTRHAQRRTVDAQAIARMFRRARVELGEQTVPGKVVVRSTRGRTLGYAHVWDGVWQGTVERV